MNDNKIYKAGIALSALLSEAGQRTSNMKKAAAYFTAWRAVNAIFAKLDTDIWLIEKEDKK